MTSQQVKPPQYEHYEHVSHQRHDYSREDGSNPAAEEKEQDIEFKRHVKKTVNASRITLWENFNHTLPFLYYGLLGILIQTSIEWQVPYFGNPFLPVFELFLKSSL